MGIRLYVEASEAVIQDVAGVSADLAGQIRHLDGTYQRALIEAGAAADRNEAEYAAYVAHSDAMALIGHNATLYASLAYGDGFNRFQGRHLVGNEISGTQTDPLAAAELLEAQQRLAWDCHDEAFARAFVAALRRAKQAALRGDLTVSWG